MSYIRLQFITCLLIVACYFTACEKPVLNSGISTLEKPVVQAYFHPGRTAEVKITRQIPINADSATSRGISGLIIRITAPSGTTYTLADQGNGTYLSDSTLVIKAEEIYQLSFDYQGVTIDASTMVPSAPKVFEASADNIVFPSFSGGGGVPSFPDPIELTWENTDGAYYLIVVENIETDPTSVADGRERPTFRSEPEQTNRYELSFRNFSYYGTHRVILFKINPEYASLYDDNGNSSQNLTTPFTNITGGLGIFTGINSDTLFVEVE
jgi:Domain of unknown function (DUF4249)